MDSVRKKIILWLFGERITQLETQLTKIEKYLSNISDLADYVKEKEETAAEIFSLAEELKVVPDMSKDDILDAIRNASIAKTMLLDSPAIGSAEIQVKNNQIFQVEELLKELGKKLKDADKAT